ncbi:MAG: alpha/beta hydrolase [Kouleothrix sp.]|nr:alpha/beta hydrolase [Kouleothrix sp.]
MRIAIRYLVVLAGAIAALPLGLLLGLAFTTPITLIGGLYLGISSCAVIGMITAQLRRARYRGLARTSLLLLLLLAGLRIARPASSASATLTVLPSSGGIRWLNRLFDEQDIVLFGERVGSMAGIISPLEDQQLVPALAQAYHTMRNDGATPLSPFLSTTLGRQQAEAFDTLIFTPDAGTAPRFGVVFLHGFGGNFTMQCWLVARAAQRIGGLTACPSASWRGDWWTPQGERTLHETIAYLERAGIDRIYLAGISNGGVGVSRLAPGLGPQVRGIILISGSDPEAASANLPALIIQGLQDERMPAALAQQYSRRAGPLGSYYGVDGDHFVLLKQADAIGQVIADWLSEQEKGSARTVRPATLTAAPRPRSRPA